MRCPSCSEIMIVVEDKGVELDVCPSCRGTWFDAEELELVVDRADVSTMFADASDEEASRQLKCPRCGAKMDKMKATDGKAGMVVVDRCPRGDGLWFDAGEVDDLIGLFK